MSQLVRMLTGYAGPGGSAHAGEVVELDDETAASFIAGGYAEAVDQAPDPAGHAIPPESGPMPSGPQLMSYAPRGSGGRW